jgi:hypothetical protein
MGRGKAWRHSACCGRRAAVRSREQKESERWEWRWLWRRRAETWGAEPRRQSWVWTVGTRWLGWVGVDGVVDEVVVGRGEAGCGGCVVG